VFGTGALLGTTYGSVAYTTREKAITVRHLLQHTTGWSNVLDGVWQVGTSNPGDAVDWQLDNTNPLYTPGTAYDYMNTDYLAAGRVIEALSGKTYEQYVKDEVLAPCGITTTMEIGNKTFVGRKLNEVVYYQPGGGDPYNLDPHRMDANGGWIARPMDLLLLMRRIDGLAINTDIISGARLTEMITGSAASGGSYGLGMLPNGTWWGHNGCMDGTIAFLVHRTDGIDFAVTCNTRPTADSCAWTLRSVLNTAINTVADTAWPGFDLFPSVNVAYDDWTVQTFPYWARFEPGLREDFWGPEADWDGDRIHNPL
jgi:CubicO group peptidase (beta-lactamase class C family)